MPLSALAPDQRAVVQLVLQQERSYDDLAGMLGISSEAVRDRARAGLDRLTDPGGLSDDERGDLADYLLGQQSVSKREAVRGLLASSADARDWAGDVADQLSEAWPSVVLPEVPEDDPEPTPQPAATEEPTDFGFDEEDDELEPEDDFDRPFAASRPLPREEIRSARTVIPGPAEAPRNSLMGGALLLAGLAVFLVALIVWLFNVGDDEKSAGTPAKATPTASAAATPQPAAAIELKSTTGGKATGQLVLFVDDKSNVTFQIAAQNVPQSKASEAYAVWLTGGDKPHRLGFAPAVGKDGVLATSGPRDTDAQRFPQWFTQAKNVVVSRETTGDATKPGEIILRGKIDLSATSGGATGTGSG